MSCDPPKELYKPSPFEEAYAIFLLGDVFQQSPTAIRLSCEQVMSLLSKSNVNHLILRNIWAVIDPGDLELITDIRQFDLILRLISLAQSGVLIHALAAAYQTQQGSPVSTMRQCLFETSELCLNVALFEGVKVPIKEHLRALYYRHQQSVNTPPNGGYSLQMTSFVENKDSQLPQKSCRSTNTKSLNPDLALLLHRLKKNDETLTELHLEQIGDSEMAEVAKALRKNEVLKRLDLYANFISPGGAKLLAAALKRNKSLQELNLSYNDLQCEGVEAIANSLKKNTTITELNLANNNIDNNGAFALARVLRKNHPSLRSLDLDGNRISNKGVTALAKALKENSVLTNLNLCQNYITNKGAKELTELLKENSILKCINLGCQNLNVKGVTALAKAMKETEWKCTYISLQLERAALA